MSTNESEVECGAENTLLSEATHEVKQSPPHLINCTSGNSNKIEQSNSDNTMKCDNIVNEANNLPKVSLSSSVSSSPRISRASSICSSTRSETYKPPFLRHVMGLTQMERALLTGWQSMNILSTTRKELHEMETQKESTQSISSFEFVEGTTKVQETNEENEEEGNNNSSSEITSKNSILPGNNESTLQKDNDNSHNNNAKDNSRREQESITINSACTNSAATVPANIECVASTDNSANNIIDYSNNNTSGTCAVSGDVSKTNVEALQVKKPFVAKNLRKQIRRSLSVPSLRNNTNYHLQQQQQQQQQKQQRQHQHEHQHYYVHNYCKPKKLFLHQVSSELTEPSVVTEKAEQVPQESHHPLQEFEEKYTIAEAADGRGENLESNVMSNDTSHSALIVEEMVTNISEEKPLNVNSEEVLRVHNFDSNTLHVEPEIVPVTAVKTSVKSISEAVSDIVNEQISFVQQEQQEELEQPCEKEQNMQNQFTGKSKESQTKVEEYTLQNSTIPTLYNGHQFTSYAAQNNTLPPTDINTSSSNSNHLQFNNSSNNNNNIFYVNSNFSNTPIMNTFSSPSTCTPVSNTTQPNMHVFNYSNMLGTYNNNNSSSTINNNNVGSPSTLPQLSPTLVSSPVSPIALSSEVAIPFYDFITVLPYYIETCLLLHERDHACRENLFRNIQAITKKALSSRAELRVHGSVVTNLALPSSDIDLLVMYYEPLNPLEALQALASALLTADDVALAEACRYVSETLTAAAQASAMSKQTDTNTTEHGKKSAENNAISNNAGEECSGINMKDEKNNDEEEKTTIELTTSKELYQKSDNLNDNNSKVISKQQKESLEEEKEASNTCENNISSVDMGANVTTTVTNSISNGTHNDNNNTSGLEEMSSLPEIQITSMTTPTLVGVDSENLFSSVQSKHSINAQSTTMANVGADEEYVNEAELECAEEVYRDQIEKDYSFSTPCELSSIFAKVNVVHHTHPHSTEFLSASFTTKSNIHGDNANGDTNTKRKNEIITTAKKKKKKDIKVKMQASSSAAVGDHNKINAEAANYNNECENTNDESASSVYYSPFMANSSSRRYEQEAEADNSQSEECKENEDEHDEEEESCEREDNVNAILNTSCDVNVTCNSHRHYNEVLASDFPVTGSVLLAVTSGQQPLPTSLSSASLSSAPLLIQQQKEKLELEDEIEQKGEENTERTIKFRRSVGTNTNTVELVEESYHHNNNNDDENKVRCKEFIQAPETEVEKELLIEEEEEREEAKENVAVPETYNPDNNNVTSNVNTMQNMEQKVLPAIPTNYSNNMNINNSASVNTTSTLPTIPLLTEQYHWHPYQPFSLYHNHQHLQQQQHQQQQQLEIPLLHSISHESLHRVNSLPYYSYVPTREGPLFEVQAITSTRVPVIKITERATNLRADITFAGGEHWRSMQFTRELLRLYPHARGLILFLKHCIKCLEIGENKIGGVTSFALYLMVRHFFNECTSRIVCILREQEVERERNASFVNNNNNNMNNNKNGSNNNNSDHVNRQTTQTTANNNNNMYSTHQAMYYSNPNTQPEQVAQTQQLSSSSSPLRINNSNTNSINKDSTNTNSSSPLSSVTMSVLESLVHGYLSRVSERYTSCEGNLGECEANSPMNYNCETNTTDKNSNNSKAIHLRGNTQLRPVEEAILGYLGFSHDAIVAGNREELFTSPIAIEPMAMDENECNNNSNNICHELQESECAGNTKNELVSNAVGPAMLSSPTLAVHKNIKTTSSNNKTDNNNKMQCTDDEKHSHVGIDNNNNKEEIKVECVQLEQHKKEQLHEELQKQQQEEEEILKSDKIDDREGNKANLLRNFAIDFLRHRVGISQIFCDFCHYYGCAFNYETDGIQFDSDGSSRVIAKPYMCVVRGQYFHLTSPFDPEYDITARMTCMRDFQ